MTGLIAAGAVRQLILQPTPFCNIDCNYCYLPNRDDKSRLPIARLRALTSYLSENDLLGSSVEVRWHAGEPLTAGLAFFREALPILRDLTLPERLIRQSLQTNGMLITSEWARLLREFDVRIGVSLDGPPELHDRCRRTRRGEGTHAQASKGMDELRRAGVTFDVIAVVTAETLANADAFFDYFATLDGLGSLGINVEETEGAHLSTTLGRSGFDARFRDFLARLWRFSRQTGISVREFDGMRDLLLHADATSIRNTQNVPFTILSLSTSGELGTFSPELLGHSTAAYETFAIGHVDTLPTIGLGSGPTLARLTEQISAGVSRCRSECNYYRVCGGGAPANKLFETGSLSSTRTRFCEATVMCVADVVLSGLEQDAALSIAATGSRHP